VYGQLVQLLSPYSKAIKAGGPEAPPAPAPTPEEALAAALGEGAEPALRKTVRVKRPAAK
jgi:hypothetical protein